MWDYILVALIGAAIPLITLWLQSKEKRKYFELERKEKLKLVAIYRRLNAHQEAFIQWDKLVGVIHKPLGERKVRILQDARDFWIQNSLFLERDTRKRFSELISIVSLYKDNLDAYKTEIDPSQKSKLKIDFQTDWEKVMEFPEILQREVELEAIRPAIDTTPEGEKISTQINREK